MIGVSSSRQAHTFDAAPLPSAVRDAQTWIGPAPIRCQGELWDGRRRSDAWRARGRTPPDAIEHAPRALVTALANEHPERAAQAVRRFFPLMAAESPKQLQAFFGLKLASARKLWRAFKPGSERHKRPRRSADVVQKLKALVRRCEDSAREASVEELRDALGMWDDGTE